MGLPNILEDMLSMLLDKNSLKSWSIFQEKCGIVTMKIRFECQQDAANRVEESHFMRKPANQLRRDRLRSTAWKSEQCQRRVPHSENAPVSDAVKQLTDHAQAMSTTESGPSDLPLSSVSCETVLSGSNPSAVTCDRGVLTRRMRREADRMEDNAPEPKEMMRLHHVDRTPDWIPTGVTVTPESVAMDSHYSPGSLVEDSPCAPSPVRSDAQQLRDNSSPDAKLTIQQQSAFVLSDCDSDSSIALDRCHISGCDSNMCVYGGGDDMSITNVYVCRKCENMFVCAKCLAEGGHSEHRRYLTKYDDT